MPIRLALHFPADRCGPRSADSRGAPNRTQQPSRTLISVVLVWILSATLAAPIHAGPNAGGTLVVHGLVYQSFSACDAPIPEECAGVDVSGDMQVDYILSIFAAFPSGSNPSLRTLSFGVDYREDWIFVQSQGPCDAEPDNIPGWPNPRTGTTLTFDPVRTGHFELVHELTAIEYFGGGGGFRVIPHPEFLPGFGDGADPPVLDSIVAFGLFGFGIEGRLTCPDDVPTGACCRSDGSCYVTWELECDEHLGAYLGDSAICDMTACESVGACCGPDEECSLVSALDCVLAEGRFADGAPACDPNPCEETIGACCQPDGLRCFVMPETECEITGVFLAGEVCAPSPCVAPCCLLTGDCELTEPGLCVGPRGEFLETCADLECPQSIGACCFGPDSDCSIEIPRDCELAGGVYVGDGTNCGDGLCLGACCLANGSCELRSPADCDDEIGQFLGMATPCDPQPCVDPGVCCFDEASCRILMQVDCVAEGGEYLGGDDPCDAESCWGACCWGDECYFFSSGICETQGGVFLGSGVACADVDCATVSVSDQVRAGKFYFESVQPNPASGLVRLRFAIPDVSRVHIALHSASGARVALILAELRRAGSHEVEWRLPRNVSAGVYFVRLRVGDSVLSKRVVVAR